MLRLASDSGVVSCHDDGSGGSIEGTVRSVKHDCVVVVTFDPYVRSAASGGALDSDRKQRQAQMQRR